MTLKNALHNEGTGMYTKWPALRRFALSECFVNHRHINNDKIANIKDKDLKVYNDA